MVDKRACAVRQRLSDCFSAASSKSPVGGGCNPITNHTSRSAHWSNSSEAMSLAMAWTDGLEKLTTMPPSAGGPPPV